MSDIFAILCERLPLPLPDGLPAGDETEECIIAALSRHWMPPPRAGAVEWCREKLRLTDGQSPNYGGEPFDFDRIPHAKIIVDFLNDPEAETLSIMKSSAAALSTAAIAAIIHQIYFEPGGVLYLITNQEEAKKLSQKVWRPFLKQVFGAGVMDKEDQANLHLKVNGIDIYCGAPTEGLMRNKQVKYIVEDESDTLPDDLPGGGNDLEVSQGERTKNTVGAKIIRLCAPLRAWDKDRAKEVQPGSRIHRCFLGGDQRKYVCPCYHCGVEQEFSEADFAYEQCRMTDGSGEFDLDRLLMETVWRCPLCQGIVHDSSVEKSAMIHAGRWVPTVKARSRKDWSAWHTDYLALIGTATWGRIAYNLEKYRGTLRWAAVRRSHLGEPEKAGAEVSSRDREMILKHCGPYDRGTCPCVPWAVALVSDVQHDRDKEALTGGVHLRFPWMLGAIAREPAGAIYVIDWGEVEDYTSLYLRDASGRLSGRFARGIPLVVKDSTWQRFFPGRPVPREVFPKFGLIDSGFYARGVANPNEGEDIEKAVYSFCLRSWSATQKRFHFLPVKGRWSRQVEDMVVETEAEYHGKKLPLYFYDDWAFKTDMDKRLRSDPECPTILARSRPRVFLPRQDHVEDGNPPDSDLISHLTAERLMHDLKKDNYGREKPVTVWRAIGRNDWWDDLKWLAVLAEILARDAARKAGKAA